SFDPHIRVTPAMNSDTSSKVISNFSDLETKIRKVEHVASVAPVLKQKAVLVHYTLPRVVMLTGIAQQDVKNVSGLGESMQSGKLLLDDSSIIVGQLLADNLAIVIGDTLQVFSPLGMERILTEPVNPKSRTLIVRGIFAANNRDYDGVNAYTSIAAARDLFNIPEGSATTLELRLSSINDAPNVKSQLASLLDTSKYRIDTWYDLHTDLYNVMEMERWIAYIILILIVAVASFSIFSALTLTVFEKRRDIGLLVALGAEQQNIQRIYLYQGLLTGLLGTLAGCLLGFIVVWAQKEFGFFTLDTSVYIIPALPVELHWQDFFFVSLGAMLLVSVASFMPSRRAARTSPAEALRWE
ncbi:MAG: FtsX-like permease family protein, partial [Bacteroidota bacterium]|nr:FtsX-like permease family protein [Bacteroidota bacterium]